MEINGEKHALAVENADLSGSVFHDVNLARATFDDINLSQSVFKNINLRAATFRDVNLGGVDIAECNLEGMKIDGVPVQEALAAWRKMTAGSAASVAGAVPFLACADVAASIEWYKSVLGLSEDWRWGEPLSDAGLRRGGVTIFLTRNADLAARVAGQEIVLMVDEVVDALYARHTGDPAASAAIVSRLETKPWGTREYTLKDPSGYLLRITQVK